MRYALILAVIAFAVVAQEPPKVAAAPVDKTLHSTLLLPKDTTKPMPIVLLISGSGPTDRNGNSPMLPGKNNSLLMLAEGLASNGISSLRYDKRGVGESAGAMVAEADLRLDTYVDDAMSWCEQLRKDKRFSVVIIAGHSEGSLIGMLAAKRCNADGFISISGAGRAAADILRTQLAGKLPPELATKERRDPQESRSRQDDGKHAARTGIDLSPERAAVPDLLVPLRPGQVDRRAHDSGAHHSGDHRSASQR